MPIQWLMGLSFVFVLGHTFSAIMEGSYIGASETETLNGLSRFGLLELRNGGITAIPQAGATFFSNLPDLITWNYNFSVCHFKTILSP